MVNIAVELKIPKTGSLEQLKTRIVQKWLETTPEPEVLKIGGFVSDGAGDTGSAPTGQASSAPDLTLFNRGSISLGPGDVQDKTTFFTGIEEGPALQDLDPPTANDLLEQASDGALPLAALVKISHGFQEVGDHVAILLAGWAFAGASQTNHHLYVLSPKSPKNHIIQIHIYKERETGNVPAGSLEITKVKIKRNIVRRVVMGPQSYFTPEILKDELSATGLELWGIMLQEDSLVEATSFLETMGIADVNLHVGKMGKMAPKELSEGSQWISSNFVNFGSAEAGCMCSLI